MYARYAFLSERILNRESQIAKTSSLKYLLAKSHSKQFYLQMTDQVERPSYDAHSDSDICHYLCYFTDNTIKLIIL